MTHSSEAPKPAVLAVVLHYKDLDMTLRCVEHLQRQTLLPRILVVDNGSGDQVARHLAPQAPGVEVSTLDTNVGFAAGMNVGLVRAIEQGFTFVWPVNNDAFAEPRCLEELVRAMTHTQDVGMTTPLLVSRDGSEQHVGGSVDWDSGELHFLTSSEFSDQAAGAVPRNGLWLTGTAPLLRTSVLRNVGIFEPAFFAYWEDVDLSLRLTRAGHPLLVVPEARVVHLGSVSLGNASPLFEFLITRNAWLFLSRNAPSGSSLARWLRFVAHYSQRAAVHRYKERHALSDAALGGIEAARRRRYFRPESLSPTGVGRFLRHAPWRATRILDTCASWLDSIGPAREK